MTENGINTPQPPPIPPPLPSPLRSMARPAPPRMPFSVRLMILLPTVAILAAIAIPNFFEAQTRTKVAKVKGDMRTVSIALETYYLDQHCYPAWTLAPKLKVYGEYGSADQPSLRRKQGKRDPLITLTTPVSYIIATFGDPFTTATYRTPFSYWSPPRAAQSPELPTSSSQAVGWILWCRGPDQAYDLNINNIARLYDPAADNPLPALLEKTYDPTNGTTSRGDIWRVKQE